MKSLSPFPPVVVLAMCVVISACANHHPAPAPQATVGKATTAQTSKPSKLPFFSLARFLPGPRVQVVKVREKDLKPLPTGHERALAFENQHKRGFWFFGGPMDFIEPTLPEPGGEMDGSLLPPRMR